jgi:transcriptional regulator GlxA family with amidase domain
MGGSLDKRFLSPPSPDWLSPLLRFAASRIKIEVKGNPRLNPPTQLLGRCAMKYAVLIYDNVEPIDLGAAFGVLSMARRIDASIEAFALAKCPGPVSCANGLQALAAFGFDDHPPFDVLIVTGGPGWVATAGDAPAIRFLQSLPPHVKVASLCTGAMILATAGLLDGRSATSKIEVSGAEQSPLGLMEARYPAVNAVEATAVLSDGVLTSGGVTLALDGMFYLLRLMHGEHVALETARIMEYGRALTANAKARPPIGLPAFPE